jgi:hypothetical protein
MSPTPMMYGRTQATSATASAIPISTPPAMRSKVVMTNPTCAVTLQPLHHKSYRRLVDPGEFYTMGTKSLSTSSSYSPSQSRDRIPYGLPFLQWHSTDHVLMELPSQTYSECYSYSYSVLLFVSVGDATLGQIVRTHLNRHSVAN